ncbi:MAG: DUF58 domain-containing protein [Planctomycetes bacterium]|nr:DUF58 domain-containing protein [Planctomycetota bacterium]
MNAYETVRAVTRLSTFLVFLAATAALGLVFRSPVLLALFEAGTAFLILSYLYVLLAARRVDVARSLVPRAYEEDSVSVTLSVRHSGLLPLFLVEVRDWCPIEAVPGKTLVVPELPGRNRPLRVRYTTKADRGRGRFTLGPVRVTISDPLGLFRRERTVAALSEIVVYPKTFPIRDLGIREIQETSLVGAANPRRSGSSPLFYGTREYQAGDNPRRIHWRASARWGRLVLKEFENPADVTLTGFLDLDRATLCGLGRGSNIERGIAVAASAAEYAESRGHPFQLIADGEEPVYLPPRVGRRSLLGVLDALARVRCGRTPLLDLLRRGARFVAEGSAVLVLFNRLDFDRDGFADVAAEWRRKSVQGAAVVMDDLSFLPIEEMRGPQDPNRMVGAVEFLRGLGWSAFVLRAGDDLEQVFAFGGVPEAGKVHA